jgi:hypothetical protein
MLLTCVCETLGDDSHNHAGGVGVSGHNKSISTKRCLGKVFVFFFVCVFVSQFTSSWICCCSPIQWVLFKVECK